jgi:flagellar hook-basal body complex protein FliE
MDMNPAIAALSYASARPATSPTPMGAGAGEALSQIGQDFAATLKRGEDTAKASMTGGADAHALVQALAQTELAIETAVAVRDRVVEAYQEILRMPV